MAMMAPQPSPRQYVRTLFLCFIAFVALAGVAAAQTYTLSGGVYGGGSALGGAAVDALTNGTTTAVASTTTNATGQYSMALPAGTYDLRVTPPASSGFGQEIIQDIAISGDRQYDVILLSGASRSVTGYVRGVNGQPVGGVTVQAVSPTTWQTLTTTTTDATGRYTFSVSGSSIHLYFTRGSISSAAPSYWYWRRYNLAVTGATAFDLTLPIAVVSGTITDSTGAVVPGATVQAWSQKSNDAATQTEWYGEGNVTANSAGSYSVTLLTGTASFTVRPPSTVSAAPVSQSGVALTGSVTRDFTLGQAVVISGYVRGAGGQPVSGVNVQLVSSTTWQALLSATTDSTGKYALSASAGTFHLYFTRGSNSPAAPSYWYWRRYNLAITGATTFDLTLPIAVVSGTIADSTGAVVPGATVQAWSQKYNDAATQTEWYGDGYVTANSAGSYSVTLLTGTASFTVRPPSTVSAGPVSQSGVALTESVTRDFTLGEAVVISGYVRGVGGQPVSGAQVQLLSSTTWQTLSSTTTDGAGKYTLSASAGTYHLYFRRGAMSSVAPNYWYWNRYYLPVTGNMSFDLNLPVVRVNGTASDSNGVPVGQVFVQGTSSKSNDATTQTEWYSDGSATTPSAGTYVLDLLKGTANLQIRPSSSSGFATAALSNVTLSNNVTQRIILQRPDATPPIITAKPVVVHLSDTSVSIGWTTNEPATSTVFFRRDTGGMTGILTGSGLTTSHSITLAGLEEIAIYEFWVESTDASGNGPVKSAVGYFKTQAYPGDIAAPVISAGPTVASISDRSAVILWTTDEPSTTRVDYGTALPFTQFVEDAAGRFVSAHSTTLTGLLPSTTYYLRVTSIDPDGNGPTMSSTITFATADAPDTLAPVITNLAVTAVTHDSITVGWTTNEAATSAVSYNDGSVYNVVSSTSLATSHSVTLAGLSPQKTYTITVGSKDAAGNGPTLASPFQATTLAAPDTVAPVVSQLTVEVAKRSAAIAWQTNEATTSEVRYGQNATALDGVISNVTLGTSHSMSLTGLAPSTTYYGFVLATDASGNATTSTFQFTTLAEAILTPPTAPGPITVTSTPNRTGAFTITWGASTDDGAGGVRSYEVFRNGESVAVLTANETSFSETALAEGTYAYVIRAADYDAQSADSAAVNVVVDMTAPALEMLPLVETNATTSTDAIVSFNVTAADNTDPNPVVVCTPASGSVFAIGDTTVNCSAADAAGNRATGSFTVRVKDPFPPILTVPPDRTVDATSADGAVLTYAATATDNADDNPTVTCEPASGSTFPVGTTIVTCTATDESNNSASRTFKIIVRAPAKAATTTTLGSSATTVTYGASVTLTASVTSNTGTPSGSVEFLQDGIVAATVPLSAAQWTPASLPAGSYTFTARYVGSSSHEASASSAVTAEVLKAPVKLTLSNLTATYDGTPKAASVTAAPAEVPVTVTYDGNAALPVNAGQYAVVATVADSNYEGTASATLTIARATPDLAMVEGGRYPYSGVPRFISGVCTGVNGVPLETQVLGPSEGALDVGVYTFEVVCVESANYVERRAQQTIEIVKAQASVTLENLSHVFDGTAKTPAVTTYVRTGLEGPAQPVQLAVSLTYDGSPAAPINAGGYEVVATVNDPRYEGSATGTLTIAKATPVVNIVASPPVPYDGLPHGLTATASGVNNAPLSPLTVTYNGSTTVPAGVGSYAVVAAYPGGANYEPAQATASLTIVRGPAAVQVSVSPSPSGQGDPVVMTVSVGAAGAGLQIYPEGYAAAIATGTVDIFVDGAAFGSAALDASGKATFSTGSMPVGNHTVSATYSGDVNYTPSQSSPVAHTVNGRAASTETSIVAPSSAALDAPVTIEAAVSAMSGGTNPTGTVQFVENGVVIGAGTLSLSRGSMRASIQVAFTTAGPHQIVARYLGDGSMSGSSSSPAAVSVYDPATQNAPAQTNTLMQVQPRPKPGVPVEAQVSVQAQRGGTPTGTVSFYVDGVLTATVVLANGSASYTFTGFSAGSHELVAIYSGDASFAGSTSREVVTVSK